MRDASRPDGAGGAQARGRWPLRRTALLDWLVGETGEESSTDRILVGLCVRLRGAGVPIARLAVHLRTDNPQWLGTRVLWRPGMIEAEVTPTDYGVLETEQFLVSPVNAIISGADEVRCLLEGGDTAVDAYPIMGDLRRQGMTDYVAWPLKHTSRLRHVISFATDRPGGFTDDELSTMADPLPVLALVTEVRLKNRLARTLLETYVGHRASERILSGSTRRGSGATVGAAILVCDLRDFTAMSETLARDDVIGLLNAFFDAMSAPIETRGGEILKFTGDGLLAVFPLSEPQACERLLDAVLEARGAMRALNVERAASGAGDLRFGIGVHSGDVMYGNIGSRARLDFTVIGPAVNVASRLEGLTKVVGRDTLFSSSFLALLGDASSLERIGTYALQGVGAPVEVFGLA